MPFAEDSYGRIKRLDFVASAVSSDVRTVLDVGCGTGSQLTRPLAEAFPVLRVLGIDADRASLEAAQAGGGPVSLSYALADTVSADARFDLVIASEVIEHVEDPYAFLLWLRDKTAKGGRIVLTVPNGYGPAEVFQLLETIMTLSGVWPFLRRMKRGIFGPSGDTVVGSESDSFAVSPHVNFFTRKDLNLLFAVSGLVIKRFAPRTFLCGFLLDQLVSRLGLIAWNARIADRLPSALASDWMFELRVKDSPQPSSWSPSLLDRIRRSLNKRRWNLASPTNTASA